MTANNIVTGLKQLEQEHHLSCALPALNGALPALNGALRQTTQCAPRELKHAEAAAAQQLR